MPIYVNSPDSQMTDELQDIGGNEGCRTLQEPGVQVDHSREGQLLPDALIEVVRHLPGLGSLRFQILQKPENSLKGAQHQIQLSSEPYTILCLPPVYQESRSHGWEHLS